MGTILKSLFTNSGLLLMSGVVVVCACSPDAESAARTEASDSAGVRIVENQEPRWRDGEGWMVSSEAAVTIGVLDGRDEYQLVGVSSAARQSDGDIVIADRETRTVRLYDGNGTFVHTLGTSGGGPGEFRNPGPVIVTPGDTVLVWDASGFRLTRYAPSGELIDAVAIDLATLAKAVDPPLYPGTIEPLAGGGFLVRLVEKAGVKGSTPGKVRNRSGALRASGDLAFIDTLMFFGDVEQVSVEAPWGSFVWPQPLGRQTWTTHGGSPARICIGDQEAPQITCFDSAGTKTLVRWEPSPRPVTDEELAAWREENSRAFGEKMSQDEIDQFLDQFPIPETRPVHGEITLDAAGNLWISVGPTPGTDMASMEYLVFDPEGVLLGSVPLPPVRVMEIGSDYVMGIYQDELEVEYLKIYRLERGSVSGTGD